MMLPVYSIEVFLKRDLGVSGFIRYCLYSNDKQYTVDSSDLCPLSIDIGLNLGKNQTGFLAGEYQDGMTKVCVYNVLGEQKAIRKSGISICSLTEKF